MSKDKIAQKEPSSQPINGPASDLELVRFSAKDPAEPTTGSVTTDFDLEMFRAEPGPVAIPVEGGIDAVRVVKPPKMEFIFIHPTWREYIWMILPDFKRRREAHLVLPAIAKSLPNICRRVLLVPYCSDDGNYYLWYIPQEDATGRINEYNKSAMRQLERAADKWCQFEANMGNQTYNVYEAIQQREAPSWPPQGLDFLIRKAFEDRNITTKDHPLLGQLRGRQICVPWTTSRKWCSATSNITTEDCRTALQFQSALALWRFAPAGNSACGKTSSRAARRHGLTGVKLSLSVTALAPNSAVIYS